MSDLVSGGKVGGGGGGRCSDLVRGGGENIFRHLPLRDQVRTSTPSPPPETRSDIYPPPPGPGQNIYPPPPPETRSDIYPPPGTRSEHLPPRDQVRTSTPPPHYTQAGGTHPTGMHSCFEKK